MNLGSNQPQFDITKVDPIVLKENKMLFSVWIPFFVLCCMLFLIVFACSKIYRDHALSLFLQEKTRVLGLLFAISITLITLFCVIFFFASQRGQESIKAMEFALCSMLTFMLAFFSTTTYASAKKRQESHEDTWVFVFYKVLLILDALLEIGVLWWFFVRK